MKMIITAVCSVGIVLFALSFKSYAQFGQFFFEHMTWSSNGQLIAASNAGSSSQTIEVFTLDLYPLVTLQPSIASGVIAQAELSDLAWSPDSIYLAATFVVVTDDGKRSSYLIVWETVQWLESFRIVGSGNQISWSPSSSLLTDGNSLIDANNGQVVSTIGDLYKPNWVVWHSTNENQLLLGGDQHVAIINPFTGETIAIYPYNGLTKPVFSPNGNYLALDNSDLISNKIDIVATSDYQGEITIELSDPLGEGTTIKWINNAFLAIQMSGKPLEIWDPFTNQIVKTMTKGVYTWNPQGTQFLSRESSLHSSGEPAIVIYDTVTDAVVAQISSAHSIRTLTTIDSLGNIRSRLLSGKEFVNQVSSGDLNQLIQAFTYPNEVGSVLFDINSPTIDNEAPYTIPLPPVGSYTLTATSYSLPNGEGDAGFPLTIEFEVVD